VPNTAARVRNVAPITWNDVNVQVRDGLTSGFTNIHADAEAIRRMTPPNLQSSNINTFRKRLSFCDCRVEPTRHVATRYEQRMSGGDRKRIPQTNEEIGVHEHAMRIRVAEWAPRLEHVISHCLETRDILSLPSSPIA
jgi:hypothetical protein